MSEHPNSGLCGQMALIGSASSIAFSHMLAGACVWLHAVALHSPGPQFRRRERLVGTGRLPRALWRSGFLK
jgi:hypothetical protein